MPWTLKNPPPPAKNWPPQKKNACVRAANSALVAGATEREAIFACIGAAENVDHMDKNGIATPVEFARKNRGNKKAPNVPPPPDTKVLEAEYFRDLNRMIRFQQNGIRTIIMPEVPHILRNSRINSSHNVSRETKDDYVDDLNRVMEQARAEFAVEYPDERMAAMATKAAAATNRVNEKYYTRFYKKLGLNPLVSEPWLEPKVKGFVQDNVVLIKDMTSEEYVKVNGIVSRGAQSGATVSEVQGEIRATFGVEKNRAKLIAQDQIQKFNGDLNRVRQQDAGVIHYIWTTTGDERVRSSHAARNGQVFAWKDPPSDGHPGQPVRCRCRAKPIIE